MEQNDFYTQLNNRYINIYSTGGEVERSYKKRTGDIINKDYDKSNPCFNIYDEIMKKVEETYYRK